MNLLALNDIQDSTLPFQDFDDVDYKDIAIGEQDTEELASAVKSMVERASEFLSQSFKSDLSGLVNEFKDNFCVRLGDDRPVDVPPMTIVFNGPEKKAAVRNRNCSPQQLYFMKKKIGELEKAAFIYRNPKTNWACAPLIFPKPCKDEYRFTVDLRPVNSQAKRNFWPFHNAEVMLTCLTGRIIFFNLDFLPLETQSENCQ